MTLDTDFIHTDQQNFGIIILRSIKQGKEAIRNLFKNFLNSFEIDKSKEKIVIVESNQIHIRKV